jgi:hypothetical protein
MPILSVPPVDPCGVDPDEHAPSRERAAIVATAVVAPRRLRRDAPEEVVADGVVRGVTAMAMSTASALPGGK